MKLFLLPTLLESLPFSVLVLAAIFRGFRVMSFPPPSETVSSDHSQLVTSTTSVSCLPAMPLQFGVISTVSHFESAVADTPVSERTGEESPSRSAVGVSSVSSQFSFGGIPANFPPQGSVGRSEPHARAYSQLYTHSYFPNTEKSSWELRPIPVGGALPHPPKRCKHTRYA